ncbi:MAG: glycosyltransferase family 4 protein [Bacteroidota bacterium]
MKKKLIFLYSHPIQYVAPLMRYLAESNHFDVLVLYCSDHGAKAYRDKEFNQELKWDIPLLEGYNSIFLKNSKKDGGIDQGFLGLSNYEVLKVLKQQPPSYVIVHGWNYLTHFLTLLNAHKYGHKICLRAESPMSHEQQYSPRKSRLRQLIFGRLLFPKIDYFLYIGQQNKAFFQHYGVPSSKLIFAPYTIDNQRFIDNYKKYKDQKQALTSSFNLLSDRPVILFCGKYISKKRPMDLLLAFAQLPEGMAQLVFVGEGELRSEMEAFITEHQLTDVTLTGFINQSEIPKYYALADVFVMCSQEGETWGLSTNEAMNFALPLVLSDLTGSSDDLVQDGKNGFRFRTGDVDALRDCLSRLLEMPKKDREAMGEVSRQLVQQYSFETIAEELHLNLD